MFNELKRFVVHRELTLGSNQYNFPTHEVDIIPTGAEYGDLLSSRQTSFFQCLNALDRGNSIDERNGSTIKMESIRIKLSGKSRSSLCKINTPRYKFGETSRHQQMQLPLNISNDNDIKFDIPELITTGLEEVLDATSTTAPFPGTIYSGGFDSIRLTGTTQGETDFNSWAASYSFYDTKQFNPQDPANFKNVANDNYVLEFTSPSLYRIMIVKVFGKLLYDQEILDPDSQQVLHEPATCLNFFGLPDTDTTDMWGPIGDFNSNFPPQYQGDAFFINEVTAWTPCQPFSDNMWNYVVVMYDKIITLDSANPVYNLDLQFKLNERAAWVEGATGSLYPKENSIFVMGYNIPSSDKTRTNFLDTSGFIPKQDQAAFVLCSELYYS